MIVEFAVKNFRSIGDLQTISFVATGLKSPNDFGDVDENNIVEEGGVRLLKTVGIYGPNASGKSNIIRALEYFLGAIKKEPSSESNLSALCDPFLYQENALETESYFQIVLIIKNKKYRYGFSVRRNPNPKEKPEEKYSKELIVSEWLYGTKEKNVVEIFKREGINIITEKFLNSDKIPPIPYEHTLFLIHAAAFDSEGECAIIRNFITGWTLTNFSRGLSAFRWNSLYLLEKENGKKPFLDLLSSCNLQYEDIMIERDETKPEEKNVPLEKIFMMKSFINSNNEKIPIKLSLKNNESSGTQKLFDLAGLFLRAFSIGTSAFIVIDEIDSDFHPSLLVKIIQLFNSISVNKSCSQILFTSHDTNLMAPAIMRRDQFYFTEKREDNSTRLYSLADLRGIRNDADFAKQYLAGYYGALPVLEKFSIDHSKANE